MVYPDQFAIHTIKVRPHVKPDARGTSFFYVTIVFSMPEEYDLKERAMRLTQEYVPIIHVPDPAAHAAYFDRMVEERLSDAKTIIDSETGEEYIETEDSSDDQEYNRLIGRSYEHVMNTILTYKPKQNVFVFNNVVHWGPATLGILEEIRGMQAGYCCSRFEPSSNLLRLLECLDLLWD